MSAAKSEEEMLKGFAPLVAWTSRIYARRLKGTIHEREDLEAAVGLALVTAARSYDPACGTVLKTWLISKAHYAAKEFVREARRARALHHVDQVPASQFDTQEEAFDWDASCDGVPGPDGAQICLLLALSQALAALPERERQIVIAHADGDTSEEIGAARGISKSRAYQLNQQGLERLRSALADWA